MAHGAIKEKMIREDPRCDARQVRAADGSVRLEGGNVEGGRDFVLQCEVAIEVLSAWADGTEKAKANGTARKPKKTSGNGSKPVALASVGDDG